MIGSDWIDVPRAAVLLGVGQKHVVTLIKSGDLDGYDASPSGSSRARWVIRRESVFEFRNSRRPRSKDSSPGASRASGATGSRMGSGLAS